jgi:preprotein translocase SecF subunit
MSFRFGNISIFSHTLKIDFMKQAKFWSLFSLITTICGMIFVAVNGINYSIDFLGGTEINFSTTDPNIHSEKIKEIVSTTGSEGFGVNEFTVPGASTSTFVVRLQRQVDQAEAAASAATEKTVAALKTGIGEDKFTLDSITNISGKVGKEEERRGYLALLIAFGAILVYVWYRFDLRFAPGAVACLIHDVCIALTVMTLLGKPFDVGSIAAFLTVIGYSMNDTVIVYDRIRETMHNNPRLSAHDAINLSINQTMNRTVLTSSTAMMALVVLTYFGGGSIQDFALTMLIGIIVGTYSSIYVAAPLAMFIDSFLAKRGIVLHDPNKKKTVRDPDYCPPVVLKKRSVPTVPSK